MIAAAVGCDGILLQAAPITAKVVAALPQLGIVSRIGAGCRYGRYRRLRAPRRVGRQCARLWGRRGGDACVGAHPGPDTQRRGLPPRYRRRPLALPVLRAAAARRGHDAGHCRASAASANAWRTFRATYSGACSPAIPISSTAIFQPMSSGPPISPSLFARATSSAFTRRSTPQTRGMVDARVLSRMRRRIVPRQHGARRNRRRSTICLPHSIVEYLPAPAWMYCQSSRSPPESPLLGHAKVILTPHAAFFSVQAEVELRRKAAQNIVSWLANGPTRLRGRAGHADARFSCRQRDRMRSASAAKEAAWQR